MDSISPEPNTGCWLWEKNLDKDGYGKIFFNKKHWRVHRAILFLNNKNIKNKMVLHKCDTPSCCNPEHLFIGTALENMRDKVKKGRLKNQNMDKKECLNGHSFLDTENFWIYNGKRVCKFCHRLKQKEYRLKKKKNAKK